MYLHDHQEYVHVPTFKYFLPLNIIKISQISAIKYPVKNNTLQYGILKK